jgi:hypothetical protein
VADGLRELLDYIVSHYVVPTEHLALELDAAPADNGAALEDVKRDMSRRESEQAEEHADAFADGLALAHHRASLGGTSLSLDDRKPDEDAMATALIRFLVSNDLATSRTEETEPQRYIYTLSVRWDQLQAVAERAGIDLGRALSRHAPG